MRFIMVVRIARLIAFGLVLNLLVGVGPVIGNGWSPPDSKSETNKVSSKSSNSQPSTLSRMTTGTKNFFSGIGNALTFKKSPPPTASNNYYNPYVKKPKEEPPKPSWFTSMFSSKEEPKKPTSPSEFLKQKRVDP
jgi:hypothetical protein